MSSHPHGKYFFYTFFVIVALMTFFIFRPFFVVLVLGASLAVVFHPLYLHIKNTIAQDVSWVAALLTVFLFIIILGVPLFFVGSQVLQEAQSLFVSITQGGDASLYLDSLSGSIKEIFPMAANIDVKALLGDLISFFTGSLAVIFTSTLHTIFSSLLVILSFFYFLRDGDRWKRCIIELSPMTDMNDRKILDMLDRAVSGIMKGYVFVALIQGTLLGLGLFIFGVPNPVLWGVLAGIASVIPSIGTALVAVPAVIFLTITGPTGPAIGLALWAIVLVGTVDNLLNPIVMGRKVSLPPLVVLFAILGGVALFGAPGIIIGPLCVSLLHTLLALYREQFRVKALS